MTKRSKLRIAVVVPSARPHPRMMYSLAQLMARSTEGLVGRNIADLGLFVGEHTYIDRNREELALSALYQGKEEWAGVTHLLWIDDDMVFPSDALIRLLAHGKDCVGANYPKRGTPCTPNAFKRTGAEEGEEKAYCYTRTDSTGLEEIQSLGFGLVLMRTAAFKELARPWFSTHYDKDRHVLVGEDVDFCMKFRATDRKIYVDHDLSKEIYHLGWYEYGYESSMAWEEIVEEEVERRGTE